MTQCYEQIGVRIEEAVPQDIPGILGVHATAFIEAYHTEDIPVIPRESPLFMSRATLEHFVYKTDFLERNAARWEERIASQDTQHTVLVGRHNQQVVGFSSTALEQREGRIGALYILPEYQRRGLGSALLKDFLTNTTAQDVSLDVTINIAAIPFYEHLGFTVERAQPQEDCPEIAPGKWLLQLCMRRNSTKAA